MWRYLPMRCCRRRWRRVSDSLDSLVAAAVAAGAQKGVAVTNEIVEIPRRGLGVHRVPSHGQSGQLRPDRTGRADFRPREHLYRAGRSRSPRAAAVLPGCHIRSGCKVGAGAVIGPNSILEKAADRRGYHGQQFPGVRVHRSARTPRSARSPISRPQCVVGDHCRIGDFVELKKYLPSATAPRCRT